MNQPIQQRPRLHDLPPNAPSSVRPPRMMHRTAVLLGGRNILSRLVNVSSNTVSKWMKQGYGLDQACRVYFALEQHIKELQEHHREMEMAITAGYKKRGYRFPPDDVYTRLPGGGVG